MRFNRGQLVSLVTIALTQLGQSTIATSTYKGVSPEDAHLYDVPEGQATWKCLKTGQVINSSAINDDYCDCEDGTDEPGTSACPDSRFYCANEGHIPSHILSSRVNDGICDCCDGSDEYDSVAKCPDVCSTVGKAYRKKQQETENKRRAGSKIRDKYIADGKRTLEELDAEIAKLEVELEVATEKEQRAKQQLQEAENADRDVMEKKMASPLYTTLKTHQEGLRALMQRDHGLKDELRKLTNLLDDLSRDYNPNYQDMAVKGAVMAYREWRRGGNPEAAAEEEDEGEGGDGEGKTVADEEPKKLNDLLNEGEWTKEKLLDIVDQDPLTLLDDENFKAGSSEDTGILFRIHEYLPDAVVPYFEAAVDTLLDLLLKANVITDVKRKSRRNVEEGEPESVSIARSAHQSAEAALRRITESLRQKKEAAKVAPERWGAQGEFKALDGKCVEKNFGEYTYEYCFFGRATQKPNRGGGHVSLGRFSRFEPKNSSLTPADPDFFLRQIYDSGQRCWNGPDRSVIVDLACDTENALLDVFEGEKCIYEAKVTTPAVCQPLESSTRAQSQHSAKEEL